LGQPLRHLRFLWHQ